jgi:hypothetical protein
MPRRYGLGGARVNGAVARPRGLGPCDHATVAKLREQVVKNQRDPRREPTQPPPPPSKRPSARARSRSRAPAAEHDERPDELTALGSARVPSELSSQLAEEERHEERDEEREPRGAEAGDDDDERHQDDGERALVRASPSGHGEPAGAHGAAEIREIERHLAVGDWEGVLRVLGDDEAAKRLPPALGLLWAIAQKEREAHVATAKRGVTELAIASTAALFGVEPTSELALVVAKRALRTNPTWRQTPAPPARVSAIIMLLAAVLGTAIGWFASAGYVKFQF